MAAEREKAVAIPLRRDRRIAGYAIVDAEDAPGLKRVRWVLNGGYAVQSGHAQFGLSKAMHRQVLGLEPGDAVIHHINENKLDNRKRNLELCASVSEANARPHPKRDSWFERKVLA